MCATGMMPSLCLRSCVANLKTSPYKPFSLIEEDRMSSCPIITKTLEGYCSQSRTYRVGVRSIVASQHCHRPITTTPSKSPLFGTPDAALPSYGVGVQSGFIRQFLPSRPGRGDPLHERRGVCIMRPERQLSDQDFGSAVLCRLNQSLILQLVSEPLYNVKFYCGAVNDR